MSTLAFECGLGYSSTLLHIHKPFDPRHCATTPERQLFPVHNYLLLLYHLFCFLST